MSSEPIPRQAILILTRRWFLIFSRLISYNSISSKVWQSQGQTTSRKVDREVEKAYYEYAIRWVRMRQKLILGIEGDERLSRRREKHFLTCLETRSQLARKRRTSLPTHVRHSLVSECICQRVISQLVSEAQYSLLFINIELLVSMSNQV